MNVVRSILSGMALATVLALPVRGQEAPAASAPAGRIEGAALDAIIKRLGDPSFAVREEAQKALEGVPVTLRETLVKKADAATNAEIRASLLREIGLIDERIAVDPLPISLEVKDATAAEVMAALNKAMGTTDAVPEEVIATWGKAMGTIGPAIETSAPATVRVETMAPPSVRVERRYTLKVVNQPYWEVLRQLDGGYAHAQIQKGLAFTNDGARVTQAGKVSIRIYAALDPRIVVFDLRGISVDDTHDDRGHLVTVDPDAQPAGFNGRPAMTVAHSESRSVKYTLSDASAKTMTVKGSVSMLVQASQETKVIDDISKHFNEAIEVGDSVVRVPEWIKGDADSGKMGLVVTSTGREGNEAPPAVPSLEIKANGQSLGGLSSGAGKALVIDSEGSSGGIFIGCAGAEKSHVVVTDAHGKRVADYGIPHGQPATSVHIVSDAFVEPLKMTVTVPTRVMEVTVPFEFKDVVIER